MIDENAIKLVNNVWLECKKQKCRESTENFVLLSVKKDSKNNYIYENKDNTINIFIEDNNIKNIVDDPLLLKTQKYTLFEFKMTDSDNIHYLYCSDINSVFDENDCIGIFESCSLSSVVVLTFFGKNYYSFCNMFCNCKKLVSFSFKKKLCPIKISNMNNMYEDCVVLQVLNLSNFFFDGTVCVNNIISGCNFLSKIIVEKSFSESIKNILIDFNVENSSIGSDEKLEQSSNKNLEDFWSIVNEDNLCFFNKKTNHPNS